jgi:hypothetical protein
VSPFSQEFCDKYAALVKKAVFSRKVLDACVHCLGADKFKLGAAKSPAHVLAPEAGSEADPSELHEMSKHVGWRWTSSGRPAFVGRALTHLVAATGKYDIKEYPYRVSYRQVGKHWELIESGKWHEGQQPVVPDGPADVLITIFGESPMRTASEVILPGLLHTVPVSSVLHQSWQEGRYEVQNSEAVLRCSVKSKPKIWMRYDVDSTTMKESSSNDQVKV